MDQKIQRMKELIEILREASGLIMLRIKEIMSNYEYDKLYDELSDLEQETGMVLTGSPTISVGYEAVDELPKGSTRKPHAVSWQRQRTEELLAAGSRTKKGYLAGSWMDLPSF